MVINYDANGEKTKSVSDYTEVIISEKQPKDIGFTAAVISSIIMGPGYNIVAGIIKKAIEKRQKSYVASYSNSARIELKSDTSYLLKVNRYAINALKDIDDKHLVSTYTFDLTTDTSGVTITLVSGKLSKSKARYNNQDENLSVSINIKTSSTDGTILIPVIKVKNDELDFSKVKGINQIYLDNIINPTSPDVRFAVTVTETNISHIDQSVIQNILTANSSDIQTILKTIFGVK
jgi:hypothetical protein